MILPTHFISCDWGTTNFRLRLVVTDSLAVLAERTTELGVRELNERFRLSGESDRCSFFVAYLRTQIAKLPSAHHGAPIVISGMASANIGMRDLAYGNLPIGAEGANFIFEDLISWPGQQVRLISGIKSATGMMRGEETQALGLLEIMSGSKDGVLLLPGTHSKHLTFENDQFTDFTSFMTGELFEIISKKSILSNSVAPGEWNVQTGDSFREGVRQGFKNGFSSHLFAIRAGQVLRQTDVTDNFYLLSGLLIGDELAHLPHDHAQRIYLAGSGPLFRLYRNALEITGNANRLIAYDDQVISEALLAGQREILQRDA
ncbi:2-dehydro-3-deoxygalactonokinase [Neolewinella persica]|uniref:2-dehydro-3-deoxygalactonokinase n=1 Tax=Neolewinella persica TaxID=70998 RepID=UPI0003653076|nr:2-dehydro-3-deoxygalactonokinase [Neolewinella persica]